MEINQQLRYNRHLDLARMKFKSKEAPKTKGTWGPGTPNRCTPDKFSPSPLWMHLWRGAGP
jgi:hypothetical protein